MPDDLGVFAALLEGEGWRREVGQMLREVRGVLVGKFDTESKKLGVGDRCGGRGHDYQTFVMMAPSVSGKPPLRTCVGVSNQFRRAMEPFSPV